MGCGAKARALIQSGKPNLATLCAGIIWRGMLEFLKQSEDIGFDCKDPLYSLDEVKTKFQIIEIDSNHWLGLRASYPFNDEDPTNLHNCTMDFALFGFVCSDGDEKNVQVSTVFRGSGPTSSLRELRHIWWGPDGEGYTFYLPMSAVIKALEHLKNYFDDH